MIRPDVGSMIRLTIFMVVVLPHPEGPTRMTISPSGTSSVRLSTAGFGSLGYCLHNPSSRIMVRPEPSVGVVIGSPARW